MHLWIALSCYHAVQNPLSALSLPLAAHLFVQCAIFRPRCTLTIVQTALITMRFDRCTLINFGHLDCSTRDFLHQLLWAPYCKYRMFEECTSTQVIFCSVICLQLGCLLLRRVSFGNHHCSRSTNSSCDLFLPNFCRCLLSPRHNGKCSPGGTKVITAAWCAECPLRVEQLSCQRLLRAAVLTKASSFYLLGTVIS